MKKLSFVLRAIALCALIIVLIAGCFKFFGVGKKIELGEPVIIEFNEIPGLSMEIVGESDSRAVTVRAINNTDIDYVSDTFFDVNVERNGLWYRVEQKQEIANIGDINLYSKNAESDMVCGFQRFGRLPDGHYRIVYAVYDETTWLDGEPHYVAAEFYIE